MIERLVQHEGKVFKAIGATAHERPKGRNRLKGETYEDDDIPF